MLVSKYQRGDTLIEVLLAFSIFTLVAISTFALMNRGINTAQQSLETTLVRQQLDSQAELLRFIHDTNPAIWNEIIKDSNLATSAGSACYDNLPTGNAFFAAMPSGSLGRVALSNTTYAQPMTTSKIDYTAGGKSEGIWVYAVKVNDNDSSNPIAYDMHIRACWESVGSGPKSTLGTIVRLYEK